tara:strand:- start:4855 stop:6687 length:1833 start_codon:yes stop_codon:yes gene_type:complete
MATVDELKILIKAETRQLKKELDQVNRKLRTTNQQAQKSSTMLTAGFKKAALGIVGFGLAIGKTGSVVANVGSGFEDLKDSLDTVFGSVDAGDEAMQKIFKFAQTTPFQIETATKAFIALKSAGIEPSMDMLQTFADTASVSVDQLGTFEAMIRLVQRSAAGGMGLEELNMISDRGINVTGMLQEKLGLTRDELSTFGKTAEGAAEMVRVLIEELGVEFGGAMASKMDNLSTKTSNMTIAFRQLGDELFKSGLGDFLKGMADQLTAMAESIAKSVRAARGAETLIDVTGKTDLKSQLEELKLLRKAEEDKFNQGATKRFIQGKGGKSVKDMKDAALEMEKLDGLIAGVEEKLIMLSMKGHDGEGGLAAELIEFQSIFGKLQEDVVNPVTKINEQLALIDKIAASSTLMETFGTTAEEIEKIRTHLNVMKEEDSISELEEAFGELAPVIAEATNKFTNDFVQSLMDGENAMESFKNLFKDMARQIIASALQMQVIKPIMDAMFTAVGLPVGQKAGGGRVQKGMPTLVGERGAEIFVPNTGGTIMNNMNSKNALSGGGGITVVQHNNFALGVGATARAEVAKLLPQIQESSKAAVLEAAARGGSFRRGLMGG